MTYSERLSWISLPLVFGITALYLLEAYDPSNTTTWLTSDANFLFLATVLLLGVALKGCSLILAAVFKEDAVAGDDERDEVIARTSGRAAYVVLLGGLFGSLGLASLNSDPGFLYHLVAFSIFASWAAEHVVKLYAYRRGVA